MVVFLLAPQRSSLSPKQHRKSGQICAKARVVFLQPTRMCNPYVYKTVSISLISLMSPML